MKEPYILINRPSTIAEIKHRARQTLDQIDLARHDEMCNIGLQINRLNYFKFKWERIKKFFDSGLLYQLEQAQYAYGFQERAAQIVLENKSDKFMKLNEWVCKKLYFEDLWYSSKKYIA